MNTNIPRDMSGYLPPEDAGESSRDLGTTRRVKSHEAGLAGVTLAVDPRPDRPRT
jgi:hypothetical protein